MSDFRQLHAATLDLLCELRIDRHELEIMAAGYSPNRTTEESNSNCVAQLSKVTAIKLLTALYSESNPFSHGTEIEEMCKILREQIDV